MAFGALVALVVLVGALWLFDVGPFAPSAKERIADYLHAPVDCSRGGLTVVAGERETYYRCSWHRPATEHEQFPGRYEQACVVVIDGRVYRVPC